MSQFPVTSRNRVRRLPKRGHYDRRTVHAIIDEALVCHVAFSMDGVPTVIPRCTRAAEIPCSFTDRARVACFVTSARVIPCLSR